MANAGSPASSAPAHFVFEADAPALRASLFTVTGRPRRQEVERHVRERRAGKLPAASLAATTLHQREYQP
jgi:hypothetical protein